MSAAFEALVVQMVDDPEVGQLLRPLIAIATQIDRQVAELDYAIAARARSSAAC